MKKVSAMLVALFFVSTFVICGKAFAQDAGDTAKPVKAPAATEPAEAVEKDIPYSDPYDNPEIDTGADEVEVDEDA